MTDDDLMALSNPTGHAGASPSPSEVAEIRRRDVLLPCPFCGGINIEDSYIRDGRSVSCKTCGASVRAFQPNALAEARARWNTRAESEIASLRARVDTFQAMIVALNTQIDAVTRERDLARMGRDACCDGRNYYHGKQVAAEARCAELVAALEQAEACMAIIQPRSDTAEYLRILGVVRATLPRDAASEGERNG